MKKIYLTASLLLMATLCFAQLTRKDSLKIQLDSLFAKTNLNASGPSSTNYAPNFSPLTPNAASFQKHEDYQVNLATGVPDINIPLYTIQEGILNNPIMLRYHAGGHTMSEFASWVGWGFNLDYGGGSLNRSIIGMADDINSTGSYLNNPIINRNLCDNSADYTFCSVVNAGNADLDPDLFSFSTRSSGGKFMLKETGYKPFLMPWQAVDINSEINPDGTIKAFAVANPDGTNYHFGITTGGYGGTESQRVLTSSGTPTNNGITTWQIGQITSLTNENKISFQYQTGGKVAQVSQSWGANMIFDNLGTPITTSVEPQSSIQTKDVEESNIYKIFFTNGEIEFVPSNIATEPRTDIPQSPKLKEIKIYAYEGGVKTLLKSITFHYSYFKDRTNFNGRLKLDSLRMFGIAGTTPQVYRFDYTTNTYSWKYDTGASVSPNADWSNQDYFGYFNNKTNNHLIDIPSYNGVTILNGTANRSTVETYLKEGLISKITYPEGGYTTFDFEANRYKNSNVEVVGGGLRVKTIKHFDSFGTQSSMKSYKYGSDAGDGVGKLNSIWSFPSATNVGEYKFISGFDIHKSVSIGSNGLAEMSSHDGTPVYYTSVREYNETIATNTTNGYTDYTFSYEPDVIVNTPLSLVRDIEPWKRGLLLTKLIYKSDNTLLQKTVNTYDAFKETSIVNVAKVNFFNQANTSCSTCSSGMLYGFLIPGGIIERGSDLPLGTPCANPQLVYFTGQNKTGQQKITQTTERLYSGNSFVETIQNFAYDNYLQQSNITTLSSKGETLKTTYTHPYDYLTTSPYTNMTTFNYITPVVEETNLINNVQTVKKSTDYFTVGGHFNPSQIRTKIGSGTEITPIIFDTYDSRGNLTKYTLRTGQTTQLTWYGTTGTDKGKTDLLKTQTVGGGVSGLVLGRTMTYDYFSLVGLKTMTDYNGYTTNYLFDSFQRLLSIKDSQGFLLKDFYYHYANQAALTGLGVTPTNTLNYLISRTARVEQTGTKLSSQVDSTTTEIQYFDGLSKNLQSLIWKGTPDKTKDLITQTNFFDAFARMYKGLLPTPSDDILGAYKSNAETLSGAFYDNDDYPFSETFFEPSPLNRTDKLFGAGQAWRVANNEKFTKLSYLTAGGGIYKFTLQTNGSVQWSSSYDTSSLYSNLTTSERDFKTFELKDKQGRVTHKFQQLDNGLTSYAITAMVYDELNGGRLAFIIPPEAYQKFGTGAGQKQSFSEGDSLYKEAIYHYKFNAIGDLVERHIPGGGTTRFVLDKHQRVILENDSKDSTNLWKINKFDALGRSIFKGTLTNLGAKTRQAIQTDLDNFQNTFGNYAYEEKGTDLLGYTNRTFPTAYTPVETDIKEVVYYDDLSQIDTTGYGFKSAKAFHTLGSAVGLVTAKQTRNLKTNTWQKQFFYYDYRGKLIQEFHLTNRNNVIRKDYQYRFNGELLKLRIEKKNSANVVLSTKNLTWEFDHLGRKVGYVYNGKPIVIYSYDAIGRMITKKFSPSGTTQGSKQTGNWTDASSWLSGSLPTLADNVTINTGQALTIPSGQSAYAGVLNDKGTVKNFGTLNMGKATTSDLYSETLSYHIRGGLKGINLDASGNLTNNLFSYRLDYESGANGLFDGNISKQSWRSNIDNKTRSYEFSYDGDSRLKSGTYASIPAGENYSLNNVDYDLNGNIKALSRSGATNTNFTSFGNVDNLTYTYQKYSNKLLKIADATTTNADLGDFRDGTNINDDYEYWADGSLKKDKNKKIASITYNYLKLPEIITFDDTKTITTEYDAGGTKLKKIVSGGETTDYEEDDIYVNGNLYQTSHDEGRITNGIFEYNITDHNNDLRVAFKDSSGVAVPVQSIFYDPWGLSMKGMQITRNLTNFNRYQFLSRELQIETGLVDLMNRQYNPQTGQFLSQDKITDGQEHLSLYQYGWNNPILKPDPNGEYPDDGGDAQSEFFLARLVTTAFYDVKHAIFNTGARAVGSNYRASYATNSDGQEVFETKYEKTATPTTLKGVGKEVALGVLDAMVVSGVKAGPAGIGVLAESSETQTARGVKNVVSAGTTSRAGKAFTPSEKAKVISANAAKNDGKVVCEGCGVTTTKPAKSTKGVTPPKTDRQIDHKVAKSKGGSGTADNGQVLCRDCNRSKSDF